MELVNKAHVAKFDVFFRFGEFLKWKWKWVALVWKHFLVIFDFGYENLPQILKNIRQKWNRKMTEKNET